MIGIFLLCMLIPLMGYVLQALFRRLLDGTFIVSLNVTTLITPSLNFILQGVMSKMLADTAITISGVDLHITVEPASSTVWTWLYYLLTPVISYGLRCFVRYLFGDAESPTTRTMWTWFLCLMIPFIGYGLQVIVGLLLFDSGIAISVNLVSLMSPSLYFLLQDLVRWWLGECITVSVDELAVDIHIQVEPARNTIGLWLVHLMTPLLNYGLQCSVRSMFGDL